MYQFCALTLARHCDRCGEDDDVWLMLMLDGGANVVIL